MGAMVLFPKQEGLTVLGTNRYAFYWSKIFAVVEEVELSELQ